MLHKYVNFRGCEMIWRIKIKFFITFQRPNLTSIIIHTSVCIKAHKYNFIVRIMQNHALSIIMKMLISDNFTYIYLSYEP